MSKSCVVIKAAVKWNQMKECKDCKVQKHDSDFYKNKDQKDGLHPYCKECARLRTKKWRQNNPEKVKARDASRKQYFAEWRTKNKERQAKLIAEWRLNNPERRLINENRRRAAKKAGGSFTLKEWLALCEQYEYTCLACDKEFDRLSPDHVLPLVKGGRNTIDNIQPLCLSCNIKKGAKFIDYRRRSD